jgi:protein-disulfide isomerase
MLGAASVPFGVSAASAARRIGALNAPEVLKRHSWTCSFCAQVMTTVWPEAERRLVRPGLLAVRFEDFPLDMPSLEGAAVLRASEGEAYVAGLTRVCEAQRSWIRLLRGQALARIPGLADVPAAEARRRAEDATLLQEIAAERLRAEREEGVGGAPAFKIGARVFVGVLPFEAFEAAAERAHGRPT